MAEEKAINTYTLPTLYSIDKNGKKRMWKTYSRDDTYFQTHGIVDGKLVTSSRKAEIMNSGRKNETTAKEQAMLEIERNWTRQVSKGFYVDRKKKEDKKLEDKIVRVLKVCGNNINDASKKIRLEKDESIQRKTKAKNNQDSKFVVDEIVDNVSPMHASKFENAKTPLKHLGLDKENSWCYCQPKFDGNRAIIRLQCVNDDDEDDIDNYEVVITTRTKKQYVHMTSLRKHIKKFLWKLYKEHEEFFILDGELYAHTLVDVDGNELSTEARFQTLSKICKTNRSQPCELEDQIQFFVFDIVDFKKNQMQRFKVLDSIFELNTSSKIHKCPRDKVFSFEDIERMHSFYAEQGYEGIILRAKDCMYTQSRSTKMKKYKSFDTEEFIIVGAKAGKGTEKGLVNWICQDENKQEFTCRPQGTFEDRKLLMDNSADYIGKLLTVKFQGYSSDNLPRFPVGINIRDQDV